MSATGRRTRSALYERLHAQISELREQLGGLPAPHEARAIWHDIWLDETHHSTAIEGNTLVLTQVRRLLDEGRAVGNKELREYMEVRGYADAAEWVYRHGVEPGSWSGDALVTLNLHRFLLPALAGSEQLVPLPALARERLSANALRVAAVRGRLEAVKGRDGVWRSSQRWVDDYVATRYRRA